MAPVIAESNKAQRWFVETAEDHGVTVEETTSSGKKVDRLVSAFNRFENGNVKLVEREGMADSWTAFESEVATSTSGHDDKLDSVEIALRGIDDDSEASYSLFFGTS